MFALDICRINRGQYDGRRMKIAMSAA